ncbi:MAG: aldo/keto reductase [Actinobacteria bacterium]|nr:MAG: aldo/keto reductase [Actinomycetota bacterium]
MPIVPNLPMNDGHEIPQLGFGVFQVPREETVGAVLHALKTGYRSIDTAAMYGNESEVAEAIARSELDRPEVFVTTKLWNSDQGRDRALRSFEGSLSRLGFDYVDLYLIHWPAPSLGLYVETWEAFTELQRDGRVRSIGVSNFTIEHLERIIDDSGVVPAANQIELHPQLQQVELRRFHSEHGIVTEAWSPLARGQMLRERVFEEIARRRERTPAQVILRWNVQLGNVVIPRSVNPSRIEENFNLFDFSLSDEEMETINGLDQSARIGPDPRTFAMG